jgi:hypothetical protein
MPSNRRVSPKYAFSSVFANLMLTEGIGTLRAAECFKRMLREVLEDLANWVPTDIWFSPECTLICFNRLNGTENDIAPALWLRIWILSD